MDHGGRTQNRRRNNRQGSLNQVTIRIGVVNQDIDLCNLTRHNWTLIGCWHRRERNDKTAP